MSILQSDKLWQFIGQSVRGSSHIRSGKPNQDAIAWRPMSAQPEYPLEAATPTVVDAGLPIILAIADGHGSDRYIYSDRGSRFAVDIAVALLHEFVGNYPTYQSMREVAQNLLSHEILKRWKARVERDIAESACATPVENGADSAAEQVTRSTPNSEDLIPYGATLLACAVTPQYILYLQLGDGDILAVFPDGEVTRPIRKDENLIANETYSLCQAEAHKFFRFGFQALADTGNSQRPALITLSTDGYANSFETEADFDAAAKDYLKMAHERGLDVIRGHLKGWLADTSKHGSGDDITLAIVYRLSENDEACRAKWDAAVEEKITQLEDANQELMRSNRHLRWGYLVLALLLFCFGTFATVGHMLTNDRMDMLHGTVPHLIASAVAKAKSQLAQDLRNTILTPAKLEAANAGQTPKEAALSNSTHNAHSIAENKDAKKEAEKPPPDEQKPRAHGSATVANAKKQAAQQPDARQIKQAASPPQPQPQAPKTHPTKAIHLLSIHQQ